MKNFRYKLGNYNGIEFYNDDETTIRISISGAGHSGTRIAKKDLKEICNRINFSDLALESKFTELE